MKSPPSLRWAFGWPQRIFSLQPAHRGGLMNPCLCSWIKGLHLLMGCQATPSGRPIEPRIGPQGDPLETLCHATANLFVQPRAYCSPFGGDGGAWATCHGRFEVLPALSRNRVEGRWGKVCRGHPLSILRPCLSWTFFPACVGFATPGPAKPFAPTVCNALPRPNPGASAARCPWLNLCLFLCHWHPRFVQAASL